jgi:hypothetical protein
MADNTDEVPLENPTNNQSENPSDEIISTVDIETITPIQEIENMEVHHHAHDPAVPHHKKNWKSYFWEFLMLFLAVFCGFLAEGYHTHLENKGIEKRNLELVVETLRDDLDKIKNNIDYNEQKLKLLDTLISFKETEKTDTLYSKRFSYLVTKSIYNTAFYANMAAIDQMKYSGSLRLVKNKEILTSIFNYMDMNELLSANRVGLVADDDRWVATASTFLDMQNLASSRGLDFLQPNHSKPQINLANNQQNIFIFFNQAILRKSIMEMIWLPRMRRQQKNAETLIGLLEKEYEFGDDKK